MQEFDCRPQESWHTTVVIVSGLAFGIDITAHLAAMENNLTTLAVLPAGLDRIYPATHKHIAMDITRQGALISEFHLKHRATGTIFATQPDHCGIV